MKRCIAVLAFVGVALALGAVGRSATGSAPSFGSTKSYASGKGPGSVSVADLNGDAKPDLVTGNAIANTVSVLLNQGNGRFAAKRDYGVGKLSLLLRVADLNGDGSLDLVTGCCAASISGGLDTVSVLLNRGDATFRAHVDYPGSFVAVADLNGDGRPDLVTQRQESNAAVRLNRGDGSFGAPIEYPTGCCVFAVVDLNGDGRPDLAGRGKAASRNAVSVFLNQGDGSFAAKREYAAVSGDGPAEAAGDLNGDGKPDLVTGNSDNDSVSVFLNRGDGTFADRRDYPVLGAYYNLLPEAIEIGDLNHDGAADLVVGGPDIGRDYGQPIGGRVFVLLNAGNGTFGSGRGYRTLGDGEQPEIADLNQDGASDIIDTSTINESKFSVLLNNGDGAFASALEYPLGRGLESDIAISDLNADGAPDVVGGNWLSSVAVRLNTPGLCNVQSVVRLTLKAAKTKLARAGCRAGRVSFHYTSRVKKGRVISQKPAFGAVLPAGGRVALVVSRGRK